MLSEVVPGRAPGLGKEPPLCLGKLKDVLHAWKVLSGYQFYPKGSFTTE
jgi:hypothetical protein